MRLTTFNNVAVGFSPSVRHWSFIARFEADPNYDEFVDMSGTEIERTRMVYFHRKKTKIISRKFMACVVGHFDHSMDDPPTYHLRLTYGKKADYQGAITVWACYWHHLFEQFHNESLPMPVFWLYDIENARALEYQMDALYCRRKREKNLTKGYLKAVLKQYGMEVV